MKPKVLTIISGILLLSCLYANGQNIPAETVPDSTAGVSRGMTQEDINLVMGIFDGKLPYEIIGKADGFIMTGKSDEERANIAYLIYRYYRESRIMGYDEIAIYIADNYFLNGKYSLDDKSAYMEMKLFAEMNRHSLIGMHAPSITLQDQAGNNVTMPSGDQDYSVIYFYDDECPTCIRTTPSLMQYIAKGTDGLNFTVYMVYTQDSRERWMDYIKKAISPFRIPDNVQLVHLWDPDMSSDFVSMYGIISTPKLFLTDRDGIIIGRELTPKALAEVVEISENQLSSMEMLLQQIFTPMASTSDTTAITETIDSFFEDSKDNPDLFHELFYTTYQYLKSSESYTLQQGAAYLANKYIAGMPEMWETVVFTDKGMTKGSTIRADYSSVNEFIDQTALAVLMFYRNQLGKPAADLQMRTENNKRQNIYGIDSKYTVLYFYNTDCGICNAVSEVLDKIQKQYSPSDVRILAIYTGTDGKWKKYLKAHNFSWVNLWDKKRESGMFDKYDLMDVPAIYLLDKNKTTLAKDINPDVLSALLEYYLNTETE